MGGPLGILPHLGVWVGWVEVNRHSWVAHQVGLPLDWVCALFLHTEPLSQARRWPLVPDLDGPAFDRFKAWPRLRLVVAHHSTEFDACMSFALRLVVSSLKSSRDMGS